MATREFNFTVGPETAQQPTVGTPSSDGDLISRGYADQRYTQGQRIQKAQEKKESLSHISPEPGIRRISRKLLALSWKNAAVK